MLNAAHIIYDNTRDYCVHWTLRFSLANAAIYLAAVFARLNCLATTWFAVALTYGPWTAAGSALWVALTASTADWVFSFIIHTFIIVAAVSGNQKTPRWGV